MMTIIRNNYIFFVFLTCMSMMEGCRQDVMLPPPTETVVLEDMEEEGKGEARRQWIESLHRHADDIDWQKMEYTTALQRHGQKSALRKQNQLRGGGNEVNIANGKLIGAWFERGSANQAGSVIATEYDVEEDKIYLVSAGGTLLKGGIQGLDWEVVNQDFIFGGRMLKFIEYNGKKRLLALIDRRPHFSDDRGLTWHSATGITISDNWGNCWFPAFDKSNNIYLLSKPSYWGKLALYVSTDQGESYRQIQELSSHDNGLYCLYSIPQDTSIYFISKNDLQSFEIYRINSELQQLEHLKTVDTVGYIESRCNLVGALNNGHPELYIYNSEREVWKSEDVGQSWSLQGKFPGSPWEVGMFVSPSYPNVMLMGEVECYRSTQSGGQWLKINGWGQYYSDPYTKLHADMMYFNEFTDTQGVPFTLISNHGGLSISRDAGKNNYNIGLYGLNVSQYYSVRTDPLNAEIIYAGAQDQGFQRGRSDNDEAWVEFDQIISGDYGHIVFTDTGQRMWTVYPGGSVSYYENPHFDRRPSLGFTIESDDEGAWIPFLTPGPDPTSNAIYMAGGNINGGAGSHVIRAEVVNGEIQLSQWDTDFNALGGNDQKVSCVAFSPIDPAKVYVATNEGRLYYSNDGGTNFSSSIVRVPGWHYLYGTTILASTQDTQTVFVGGSGYSNDPVVYSTDGGRIFKGLSDGLPPTLVFQLASNEDESLLFAATESGPYVYVFEDNMWYDLSGLDAPNQRYWSVEYLNNQKTARFGTYGRGIWDFRIDELNTSIFTDRLGDVPWEVYPNPVTDLLMFSSPVSGTVSVTDIQGRLIERRKVHEKTSIDLSQLNSGTYLVTINNHCSKVIKK